MIEVHQNSSIQTPNTTPAQIPEVTLIETPDIIGVDSLNVCWTHEGEAADLVRALKYKRTTAVVTAIADEMVRVTRYIATEPNHLIKLVTWVPCTSKHRRGRGFDPAELIARALARRLRTKARPTLRRIDKEPQTSKSKQGRLIGPTFKLRRKNLKLPSHVMLVDDVCTTGSTLRTAAQVLRSAGVDTVAVVTATIALPYQLV